MTGTKIQRLRYLTEIPYGFQSKKYYAWFKKKYECTMWGWNAHHLLRRECDYLLYPFRHDYHLKYVEFHKAKVFCGHLDESVLILQFYLSEVYGKTFELKNNEPKELVKLFEFIKELEK